jgi:hypothetical protein
VFVIFLCGKLSEQNATALEKSPLPMEKNMKANGETINLLKMIRAPFHELLLCVRTKKSKPQ